MSPLDDTLVWAHRKDRRDRTAPSRPTPSGPLAGGRRPRVDPAPGLGFADAPPGAADPRRGGGRRGGAGAVGLPAASAGGPPLGALGSGTGGAAGGRAAVDLAGGSLPPEPDSG